MLTGPLTVEQRAKLMEIAGKCPVHRTLKSEIVKLIPLNTWVVGPTGKWITFVAAM